MQIDNELLVSTMKANKIKQVDIARMTGLTTKTVYLVCRDGECKFETIKAIADVIQVPVSTFIESYLKG